MMSNGKKRPGVDPAPAEQGSAADDMGGVDKAMRLSNGNSVMEAEAEPAIDQRIQNHLGRKLKESYQDLVRQPVPDKFNKLLEELERQEKKQ